MPPVVLDQIKFELEPEVLFKRLHLDPEGEYAAEMVALAKRVAAVARPKAIYRVAYIQDRGEDTVTIEGVRFTSRTLRANLAEVERVFAYVATCGTEMDEVPVPEGDFLGEFCRDTVKELALGAATAFLTAHLKERYSLGKLAAMHPGSGDAIVWPIQQQRPFFSLFGDQVEARIGVRLTPTFLMIPNKSVSGLFYPTEVDFMTCQLCHRERCPHRRAPFDADLWEQRVGATAPAA